MSRIAAVTPNWRWDISPLPTDTLVPPCSPPLEWAYLAAGLPESGLAVVDGYASDLDVDALVRLVLDGDPETIVVSTVANLLYWRCPPFSIRAVTHFMNALRSSGFDGTTVVVGPHGTHSPQWVAQETGARVIWRGSADVRLAVTIETQAFAECPFAYTGAGTGTQIAVDSARDLPIAQLRILDPTSYPPHAWSLSSDERAVMGDLRHGLLLETSRGCPWACAYCAKEPVRGRFDRRPLDRVESELDAAIAAGWDYVFFIDETFNVPSDDYELVLSTLQKRGMRFGFQGRPDLIDDESARRLSDAGCVYVELGVDIADSGLSRGMGRRQRLDRAERGVDAARAAIPIVRYNRLNLQTLDYREMYPQELAGGWDIPVDPVYPYPGAPLGDALMRRLGLDQFDWNLGERYSWWLRIEVWLQRTQPDLDASTIGELENSFLGLSSEAAVAVASALRGIESMDHLHDMNKAVRGEGGTLHLHRSRA